MLSKFNKMWLRYIEEKKLPKPDNNSKLGVFMLVGTFILLMLLFLFINNRKIKQIQSDLALQTPPVSITATIDHMAQTSQIDKLLMSDDDQSLRTVEYYKRHQDERKVKLEECAKYVQTNVGYENCQNAKKS